MAKKVSKKAPKKPVTADLLSALVGIISPSPKERVLLKELVDLYEHPKAAVRAKLDILKEIRSIGSETRARVEEPEEESPDDPFIED